ncbi:adenosylcobinamide-GDP ribazoletransferase [Enemella sp. A6]|uniref:adenosylcobinamide-GDP ribazoletransferase n=1 Tax=Enemella sp. A6 TaxID=3440152 RepID=UPI003EC1380B
MSLATGARLALGTLTIIPVGNLMPLPKGAAREAMSLAPVVVLPITLVAGAIFQGATWLGLSGPVAGALALAAMAVLTRAMHLDGLTDTVDGLGGGWTRERALEIMHRGDVGPMGVAALVLVLLVQAGSLAALTVLPWTGLLVAVALAFGRIAAPVLCVRGMPAARSAGMGAVMAGSVPAPLMVLVVLGSTVALTGAVLVSGLAWWWGPVAALVTLLVLWLFSRLVLRRIGGTTGDVFGAGIEIATTVVLMVLAIGAAR